MPLGWSRLSSRLGTSSASFCFKLNTPSRFLSIYTCWSCVRWACSASHPFKFPRGAARRRLGEASSTRRQVAADAGEEKASEGGVRDHRRRTHVGGRPWRCSASCWTCATSPLPCSTASSRYLPRSRPPASSSSRPSIRRR